MITGVFALFLILCTAPAVADTHEHTHGIDGEWFAISDEAGLRGITESGNYYLSEDIVLTIGEWQIPYGKTINLCLNSHVIQQTAYEEAVINIGSGSTLNLYDCGNTIHYFNKDSDTGLWTMIENEDISDYFVIGGVITGGKNAYYAGGVYCEGTFKMHGGNIVGNTATGSECAGGVCVGYGGDFTMESGEITGNTAVNGAGVCNKCTFMMNGGEITGNTAVNGAGVYVYNDRFFTMNGGIISGNRAEYSGGGVYGTGPILYLNGGSITGNTAGENGAGVYVGNYHGLTNFYVSGSPKIFGNTITGGDASNLYLYPSDGGPFVIMIDSRVGLASGADIWVMMDSSFFYEGRADLTEEGCVEEEWVEYFHIDKPEEQHLVYDAENKKIMIALGPKPVPTPPGNGDLNVTYNNLQRYVVVIPGDMDFAGRLAIDNTAEVKEMWLELGSVLKLSVESVNGFEMVQREHEVSFIPYTMRVNEGNPLEGAGLHEILSVPAGTPKVEGEDYHAIIKLDYAVTADDVAAAKFAGEHKDTLTFKVDVVDA